MTWVERLQATTRFIGHTLGWRWDNSGRKVIQTLPFYLFPAYLQRWRWRGIALSHRKAY